MRNIVFTGGGSAGHVTVNMALIPKFIEDGWRVNYIGSKTGIERHLIENMGVIDYYAISSGKLRRYFDWKNFKDPFKVMKGVVQAYRLLRKLKPDVIFSKGGFVSVPVIFAARLAKIPVISHESDITPGLANKISLPFVKKVCTTFPETAEHLNSDKAIHVGAVVREELKHGSVTRGLTYCDFLRDKPVLLIMGGSLGSQHINEVVRASLDQLLSDFQIVHICGEGGIDTSIQSKGYRQFEYISEALPDILAMSNIVVSRAGSNSIFEFLELKKPMLLIPLTGSQSRGDQILNAESFRKSGYAEVLPQEDVTKATLTDHIYDLYKNQKQFIKQMEKNEGGHPAESIITLIKQTVEQ